jgi:hypothetical protein
MDLANSRLSFDLNDPESYARVPTLPTAPAGIGLNQMLAKLPMPAADRRSEEGEVVPFAADTFGLIESMEGAM